MRVVNGDADFEEIRAHIGVSLDVFRDRGMINVVDKSPEWRAKARTIALAELDALRRSFERDRGDISGKPSFAPLQVSISAEALADPVPLQRLLSDYCAELQRSRGGYAAERRWRPCFKSLVEFLMADDAAQPTRQNVVRWKDHLLGTLQPKTVRDSHLAALKAVLTWAVDAGRLTINAADDVKCVCPSR